MRDCPNVGMRDLLPDLLHDRLSGEVRAAVLAHLDACEPCHAELELLRRVRLAVPMPRVDASRIVAALPGYHARPWYRRVDPAQMRIAAAVVLVAGGAALVITLLRGFDRREPLATTPKPGSIVVQAPSQTPTSTGASTNVAPREKATLAAMGLATGESLTDLSDAELRTLLNELGDLQAVTPTEDDVVVPAIGRGGT